jgi:hypothetical protein
MKISRARIRKADSSEGAGYAGGIISAAGRMKVVEAVAKNITIIL